ncbi:flagellar hook-length control protein FliK [Mesorhizobium shangrilense]|uniref:Flagellar hook-length control protein FliK n=1 Tax=Mesorhizobium shangrilense TaxID=460060 RepID=A0ABV2DKD1_9HYPH
MTTSVGPSLPGFVSTRAASEQPAAGGKTADTGFSDMLHSTGKQARPEKQTASETTSRDPRWGKPASSGHAEADSKDEPAPADPRKISSAKLLLLKAAKESAAGPASGKEADDAGTGDAATGASSLQDHLPLLMALHDLRQFSASAKSDKTVTGDGTGNPAVLDAQAPLSKRYRSTTDAGKALGLEARSERGSTAAEQAPQQPDGVKLPAGPMKHDDSLTFGSPLKSAADDAAPQSKPSSLPVKSLDEALSSVRPEAGKQASSANRVEVISERSFPAPAQNPMSQAAATVIDAIKADSGVRQAFSSTPATPVLTPSVAPSAHILKIELHPAELGMVTASLRLSGEQLSIELKPQTQEAYRRLASDSEAIVKSLRGLGFEVDKVTILQPSIAVPAATRSDSSVTPQAMMGRDGSSFQSGNSGGNNDGAAGQQSGRNRNNDLQEFGRPASPARERAGGDMFI